MRKAAEVDFEDRVGEAETRLGSFESLDAGFRAAKDKAVAFVHGLVRKFPILWISRLCILCSLLIGKRLVGRVQQRTSDIA